MRIPYVIDNQTHRLADVLNYLLQTQPANAMDIATAYFSVRGYHLLQANLDRLASFRLLLGAEPTGGGDLGLHPRPPQFADLITRDLSYEPYTPETRQLVEALIRFLMRESTLVRLYHGHEPGEEARRRFLHAKAYLLYSGQRGAQHLLLDRLNPIAAVVGSSNFTGAGLTTNRELNTVHKAVLDAEEIDDREAQAEVAWQTEERLSAVISPVNRRLVKSEVGARAIMDLARWYEEQWGQAEDFKDTLIEILNRSKFGFFEYTPFEVYMKALYEYFKDDMSGDRTADLRTVVELAEFQEDAVRKARRILARYDGVMIADSVGLGKTWIGKRLLEDYAYHMRQKTLVITPASLRSMWRAELADATIPVTMLTQEEMGRQEFDWRPYGDADIVLIDEAHNFRNRGTGRYQALERILSANGRRGRDGGRKKVILLTATPINNTVFDLYNQINLFTGNDRTYFAAAGIGDLKRYFLAARRAASDYEASVELFNLLEEVVIRRTRPFIRRAYPAATIAGVEIKWPERRLKTRHYNLEATYEGIYEFIVSHIGNLRLAHYSLEEYKKKDVEQDEFEMGRQQALVGIFKTRLLKRFESSVQAFRISVRRALQFLKTFETYLDDGRLLDSASFQAAMRYLEREDDSDDTLPTSLADDLDVSQEATAIIGGLRELDTSQYQMRALRSAIHKDIEALTEVWYRIKDIDPGQDAKVQMLKDLLAGELRDQKVLIFTYYRDTAQYLGEQLAGDSPEAAAFRRSIGNPHIRHIDGGTSPDDRSRIITAFAPRAAGRDDLMGEGEIDILIATDVLSEGQNLQDAGIMLNYDLHWNPTRMIQRAGRIDRLGSPHDTLYIYNVYPDEGLERLLGLVESLTVKIETINQSGFLDASVLGEAVTPRNFNTLRRIREEDDTVIEEQETLVELASSEALLREIQQQLANDSMREWIESLPDGIHSGLHREQERGVFFYFTAQKPGQETRQHYWRYYDIASGRIIDNRLIIANLIACQPDTPRFTGEGEVDIFEIQERVIEDILQSAQEQAAIEAAPKKTDPIQQAAVAALRRYFNHPGYDRSQLRALVRAIGQPMTSTHLRQIRDAYKEYTAQNDISILIDGVRAVLSEIGEEAGTGTAVSPSQELIARENLHLICYDYVWS